MHPTYLALQWVMYTSTLVLVLLCVVLLLIALSKWK